MDFEKKRKNEKGTTIGKEGHIAETSRNFLLGRQSGYLKGKSTICKLVLDLLKLICSKKYGINAFSPEMKALLLCSSKGRERDKVLNHTPFFFCTPGNSPSLSPLNKICPPLAPIQSRLTPKPSLQNSSTNMTPFCSTVTVSSG